MNCFPFQQETALMTVKGLMGRRIHKSYKDKVSWPCTGKALSVDRTPLRQMKGSESRKAEGSDVMHEG